MTDINKIPKGYHIRNSITTSLAKSLVCEVCGKKVHSVAYFEKNYPNNPDIAVCINCVERFDKYSRNRKITRRNFIS